MNKAEFLQWLSEVARQRGLSASAVARLAGVTPKTISEWRAGRGPLHPDHVRAQIEAGLSEEAHVRGLSDRAVLREKAAIKYEAQIWLDPDWQRYRAFTVLVESLLRLQAGTKEARYAWGAVIAASQAVQEIAGWGEKDWERLFEQRFKKDHWKRITKENEEGIISAMIDKTGGER